MASKRVLRQRRKLAHAPRPLISVCMIVKNEEENLDRCLRSVRSVVDEIVVVDTGSCDRTVEIARRYGAKVSHFQWCDDFAAARNAALVQATGRWVLQMDADEELTPEAARNIRQVVTSAPPGRSGFFIPCRSYILRSGCQLHTIAYRLLLFRNLPDLRYRGRIHENIQYLGEGPEPDFRINGDLTINHYGYLPDQMAAKDKLERNLRLLQLAIAESPDDPFNQFNLGLQYHIMERFADAVEPLKRATALCRNPSASYLPKAYAILVSALYQSGRGSEVPAAIAEAEQRVSALTADFYYNAGMAFVDTGQLEQALEYFERAIDTGTVRITTESDPSAHTWLPRLGMGVIFEGRGQMERARDCYEEALTYVPNHPALNCRLAVVATKLGQPGRALEHIKRAAQLEELPEQLRWELLQVCETLADGAVSEQPPMDSSGRDVSEQAPIRSAASKVSGQATLVEVQRVGSELVQRIPIRPECGSRLASACVRFEQFHLGIKAAGAALENGEDVLARVNRGFCYFALGRYQEAAEDFTAALAANPNDEDVLACLGLVRDQLGIPKGEVESQDGGRLPDADISREPQLRVLPRPQANGEASPSDQADLAKQYDRMYLERRSTNSAAFELEYWRDHFATKTICEAREIRGNVLDLGCGTGEIDIWLARVRKDVRVAGVDVSPEALAVARKHLSKEPRAIRKRMAFHDSLIESLPFADSTFDACFMSHTFEHIADHVAVFRELYRVLKPGAAVIVVVPLGHCHDDPTHVWHFQVEELEERLRLFGDNVHVWKSADGQQLAARLDLWRKPKIVCMMRIKNEERWITSVLNAASQLVDAFVILDDGSTDRTPELCQAFPKVVRYERQTEDSIDEARDKDKLLQWALDEHPDWILALDGDEVLEDVASIAIRKELAVCPEDVSALGFNFLYMWDTYDRHRVDGPYRDLRHPRLFRIAGLGIDPRSLRFRRTDHGANFHCGSVPCNIPGRVRYVDVNVKHFGYFDRSEREAKRAFYEQRDPDHASKGYYNHLTDEEGIVLFPWRERDASEVLYSDATPDAAIKALQRQDNPLWHSALFYLPGSKSHLDIGSNTGASLRGLDARSITSVERYAPAAAKLRELSLNVIEGDAREVVESLVQKGEKFDRVTMFDFIEHLPRSDGEKLLDSAEQLAMREIIVFAPIEHSELVQSSEYKAYMENIFRTIPEDQHDLQSHKSYWTPADFEKRGYTVVVLDDFHIKGFSAFFAAKYLSSTHRELALLRLQRYLSPKKEPIRLHLGCGNNRKEGYINVDKYVSNADANMDIFNLQFPDDTVDEIFTEHMLEHLGKYEVPLALKEWARVLKPDGKLVMNLPNLEWCLREWLSKPEEERWGWQLDTIFGLQNHPGEFHKTGFTAPRLRQLLSAAGFRSITIKDHWSHGQSCFWVEASKTVCGSQVDDSSPVLASIVIPVSNKVEYTKRCISAIVENTPEDLYEVIIVDNASTDGTKDFLNLLVGDVKVVSNETNRGFTEACNQGAELARGKYLVFLNNDTEPQKGWLENLIGLSEGDPSIGAVGAKLVYPNGTLQEAGGIVFSDGNGWNYGRGKRPDDPQFNFVREVDYCSGAALLVRKSIWQAIGGFDMRYAPAYYEDTDLCFAIRKAGFRVMYQPAAVVIHHEGATAGSDLDAGAKRFQVQNRSKFVKKWGEVLQRQFPPTPESVRRASNRAPGKRILVIDPFMPMYDRASGCRRLFEMLKIIVAQGHAVTFIARNGQDQERYVAELQQMGIEVYATDPDKMRQLGFALDAPAIDLPRLLQETRYDLAILSFYEIAEQYLKDIRCFSPETQIYVDTVDVHFLREERQATLYGDKQMLRKAARTKERELAIYRQADALITVTEEDRRHLLAEVPEAIIHVVPNIHDVSHHVPPWREREGLLFVGNFRHPPNVDAVLYFCQEVLPLVRAKLPNITLTIVGDAPTLSVQALAGSNGVAVTGYVHDIEPYLRSRRVSVAPLRFGAGLKGKIGEALAAGLPVVTTRIGVEGMALSEDQQIVLVADDPSAFAEAIFRVYTDEAFWLALSQAGRAYVEANYSSHVVAAKVKDLLIDGSQHRQQQEVLEATARGLTSIIILTHNQSKHTKLCLDSIALHTPEPHEIIIVDNGSTDDTLDYVRSYAASHDNVRVIANAANRGFAAGNNQGLALARGDYVLMLNNDTIVTSGWLGRMLAVLKGYPQVGIVGPVSNYASGPQLVRNAAYKSVTELEAFAAQWSAAHAGQSQPIKRVVGFCLLARRAVIERIGGFDERFGSGNFEDDDFCIRAALAGYEARIAQDVFIHHSGGQTFKGAGIDYRQSMLRNWEQFKAKWGIPADAPIEEGYRMPVQRWDASRFYIPLPRIDADDRPDADVVAGNDREIVLVLVSDSPPEHLPVCIEHLRRFNKASNLVVKVVNNGKAFPRNGLNIRAASEPDAETALRAALASEARYVILLSADVIVSKGWLDHLLAVAASDEAIAAVGPSSNAAPARQQIKRAYTSLKKELQRFAAQRARQHATSWSEVDYLGGFCLLLRSDAVQNVGGLAGDLQLADALWDLYARLRAEGFKLAHALGVYVHHAQLSFAEGGDFDLRAEVEAALRTGGVEAPTASAAAR